MARPPRTRFAAPFVVVVTTAAAGGCSDGKSGGDTTPKPVRTWNVTRQEGGVCLAHIPVKCRKDATCNPPPPMQMPCPPEGTGGSFKVVSFDGKLCFLDDGTTAVTCPSYPPPPPPPEPIDAAVQVAAQMRSWTISRGAKECFAAIDPDPCTEFARTMKPGDPIPPCNPPAPYKIKCPPADVIRIVETGENLCQTESPAKCKPGEKCGAPPSDFVDCPKY